MLIIFVKLHQVVLITCPKVKAPTIIYGLFEDNFSLVVIPDVIRSTVTMGTSKEKPNAKNSAITKSRYLPISVITATSVGAMPIKKTNINGKTTKYANIGAQIK